MKWLKREVKITKDEVKIRVKVINFCEKKKGDKKKPFQK